MNEHTEKVDRVLFVLLFGIFFFTGTLFIAKIWFKDDGAFFAALSGAMGNFIGAFLLRIKPKDTPRSMPISDKSSLDVKATLHQEGEAPKELPK